MFVDHLPHNLMQILWNVGMRKQICWNGNLMKTNVGCGNADVIVCLECIVLSISIRLSLINTHTHIHTQVLRRLYMPNHMHFPLHFHAFSARGTQQSPHLRYYTVHNHSLYNICYTTCTTNTVMNVTHLLDFVLLIWICKEVMPILKLM